jgi:hypothetical protein
MTPRARNEGEMRDHMESQLRACFGEHDREDFVCVEPALKILGRVLQFLEAHPTTYP